LSDDLHASPGPETPRDAFERVDYRRMIAWPQRIEREAPFLMQQLDAAPARSVLDLGCGTGEHARFFAAQQVRTVGIDRSAAQIDAARAYENAAGEYGPRFLHGEIAELPHLTEERFGLAVCLGNVLPSLDDEKLPPALAAVAQRMAPGGRLVIQLLNYHRIFEQRIRHLPLSFRPATAPAGPGDAAGEVLFVRLMTPDGDRHVRFCPTTLSLHPGEDPPVRLVDAHETRVRAWRWGQLEPLLRSSGFSNFSLFGDMSFGTFDAERSSDLVIVAQASPDAAR
jgi:SAM-dependent methyltransferase